MEPRARRGQRALLQPAGQLEEHLGPNELQLRGRRRGHAGGGHTGAPLLLLLLLLRLRPYMLGQRAEDGRRLAAGPVGGGDDALGACAGEHRLSGDPEGVRRLRAAPARSLQQDLLVAAAQTDPLVAELRHPLDEARSEGHIPPPPGELGKGEPQADERSIGRAPRQESLRRGAARVGLAERHHPIAATAAAPTAPATAATPATAASTRARAALAPLGRLQTHASVRRLAAAAAAATAAIFAHSDPPRHPA